jgi:hypothetical protein
MSLEHKQGTERKAVEVIGIRPHRVSWALLRMFLFKKQLGIVAQTAERP